MTERTDRIVSISAPRGRGARPRVAIVTSHWGESPTEEVVATRLIAGALARRADVSVVHLENGGPAGRRADSVFSVFRVPVSGAEPGRGKLLRRALSSFPGGAVVPEAALELLRAYDGEAPGVAAALEEIAPEAVVLVGSRQPFDLSLLGRRGRSGRARVVLVPFCSERRAFGGELARLVESADLIGAIHPGERALVAAAAEERHDDVVEIGLAVGSNPHVRNEPLAGIARVGDYVLLVRCFPAGSPRLSRAVNRDVLRTALGGQAVIEVDGDAWLLGHEKHWNSLPVNRNRVNFSRLIAHAKAMVDVRPQGPVGRIAVESMLYGVPVVVPDDTAAMAHAAAADGGLWYRDEGELFACCRAMVMTPLGAVLGRQAFAYAEEKHGDIDAFVERIAELVLPAPVRRGVP